MSRQVYSDQAGLRPSWEVKAGINKADDQAQHTWHAAQAETRWECLSSNAASKQSGKALVSLLPALSHPDLPQVTHSCHTSAGLGAPS